MASEQGHKAQSRVRLSSLLWASGCSPVAPPGPYGHTGHTQQSALGGDTASFRSGQPGTRPRSPSAVLGRGRTVAAPPLPVEMQKKQAITFPKRLKRTHPALALTLGPYGGRALWRPRSHSLLSPQGEGSGYQSKGKQVPEAKPRPRHHPRQKAESTGQEAKSGVSAPGCAFTQTTAPNHVHERVFLIP